MKKLLLIFTFLSILSCSTECQLGGDKEKVDQLLTEIADLEEKRDDASSESIANTYQNQIDRKQEALTAEMKKCI